MQINLQILKTEFKNEKNKQALFSYKFLLKQGFIL